MTSIDYEKDTWDVADAHFNVPKWDRTHQLESFNNFLEVLLPNIIKQYSPLKIMGQYQTVQNQTADVLYEIKFGDIHLTAPVIHENDGSTKPMYPNIARIRGATYSSPIYLDMQTRYSETIDSKEEPDNNETSKWKSSSESVLIGRIPIMLHSNYCILNEKMGKSLSELGECNYDKGAYFIINGSEKVILSQEKMAPNKAFVRDLRKSSGGKYDDMVEIQSIPQKSQQIIKQLKIKFLAKDISNTIGKSIRVTIPRIRQEIPLFILFRALGVCSDRDIMNLCVYDIEDERLLELLRGSFEDSVGINDQHSAIVYMSKYITYIIKSSLYEKITEEEKEEERYNQVYDILRNDVLPHVGDEFKNKSWFIGYMVNQLLNCHIGRYPYHDRDHYANKRIDLPGYKLAELFAQNFSKMVKDARTFIVREIIKIEHDKINDNLSKIFKSAQIESPIKFALSTGNWGLKQGAVNVAKQGVAQVLARLTPLNTISHVRRINTPIDATAKVTQPRKLHPSKWGMICPAETPEGAKVGIVNNLALTCKITIGSSPEVVIDHILEYDEFVCIENLELTDISVSHTKILVNGNWIGNINKPNEIVNNLRKLRRQGLINIYTSIAWNINRRIISVSTEPGRCCRPLYIVKNNKLSITKEDINKIVSKEWSWNNLLTGIINSGSYTLQEQKEIQEGCDSNKSSGNIPEGKIEYIDVAETESSMIAMTQKDLIKNEDPNNQYIINYTHCELHPSFILGAVASMIPFSDHNQSPRNAYQSSMGKQAMGLYVTNFKQRMDTAANVLHYPQKPLITTRVYKWLNLYNMPAGQNVIVAIMTYTGYNQEDSVIINQSSIDRGLFHSTFYRRYQADEKKNHTNLVDEKFCKPNEKNTKGMKLPEQYENLDSRGFIKINSKVKGNDAIIGKCMPITKDDGTISYKDVSTFIRPNEGGYIDEVIVDRNAEGYQFCKVRVRSIRIPHIGDKFASRHGQKGTIGITYTQEDMPFSKHGMTPDLLLNPHAFPSRMTVGHLLECLLGKVSSEKGDEADATPFTGVSIDSIADEMSKYGFHSMGDEVLYNGRTGEQLNVNIFMGPTYYQRLKHMVDDKIHSRATGPVQSMTRQPAEGRSRDGGLRMGEMEQWCMLSHGASQLLKERSLDVSDLYKVFVCEKCGMFVKANPAKGIYQCKACMNTTEIAEVHMPYACKLLFQELISMSIAPRLMIN